MIATLSSLTRPRHGVGQSTTLGWQNDVTAQSYMQFILLRIQPIVTRYGWYVEVLKEFYPRAPSLLGLNVQQGREVCVRFRVPGDRTQFLPFHEVVCTAIHELAHCRITRHGKAFWTLYYRLLHECEAWEAQSVERGVPLYPRCAGATLNAHLHNHNSNEARVAVADRAVVGGCVSQMMRVSSAMARSTDISGGTSAASIAPGRPASVTRGSTAGARTAPSGRTLKRIKYDSLLSYTPAGHVLDQKLSQPRFASSPAGVDEHEQQAYMGKVPGAIASMNSAEKTAAAQSHAALCPSCMVDSKTQAGRSCAGHSVVDDARASRASVLSSQEQRRYLVRVAMERRLATQHASTAITPAHASNEEHNVPLDSTSQANVSHSQERNESVERRYLKDTVDDKDNDDSDDEYEDGEPLPDVPPRLSRCGEEGGWSCPRCTFDNPANARQCQACSDDVSEAHSAHDHSHRQQDSMSMMGGVYEAMTCLGSAGDRACSWSCSYCTYNNEKDAFVCAMCDNARASHVGANVARASIAATTLSKVNVIDVSDDD